MRIQFTLLCIACEFYATSMVDVDIYNSVCLAKMWGLFIYPQALSSAKLLEKPHQGSILKNYLHTAPMEADSVLYSYSGAYKKLTNTTNRAAPVPLGS